MRPAVVDEACNEWLTRAELAARSAALAAGLSERGIGRGDLVAVAMPSSAWWPVVALGVWRAGAALAPVSPLWPAQETARVLGHVRPRIAVAFGELVPVMRGALSAARLPISVLVHDVTPETTPCTPLARLVASNDGEPFAEPELKPSDLAVLLLSSGTGGGLPKGVRLTHGDLTAGATTATRLAADGTFDCDSVAVANALFVHSLGLIGSLCAPLHAGAQKIATSPSPDTDRALELLAEARHCAVLGRAPFVLEQIDAAPAEPA